MTCKEVSVLIPIPLSESDFTINTATDNSSVADWRPTLNYSFGNKVKLLNDVYASKIDDNKGNTPSADDTLANPLRLLYVTGKHYGQVMVRAVDNDQLVPLGQEVYLYTLATGSPEQWLDKRSGVFYPITDGNPVYRARSADLSFISQFVGSIPTTIGSSNDEWEFVRYEQRSDFEQIKPFPTDITQSYPAGAFLYDPAQGKTFITTASVVASSDNYYPLAQDAVKPITEQNDQWEFIEKINRLSVISPDPNDQTINESGDLIFSIAINENYNSISLLNLIGSSVLIYATSNSGDIINQVYDLKDDLGSYWSWLWEYGVNSKKEIHVTDLVSLTSSETTLYIAVTGLDPSVLADPNNTTTGTSKTAIGAIYLGVGKTIGDLLYSATFGADVFFDQEKTDVTSDPNKYAYKISTASIPIRVPVSRHVGNIDILDLVVNATAKNIPALFKIDSGSGSSRSITGYLESHQQEIVNSVNSENNLTIRGIY